MFSGPVLECISQTFITVKRSRHKSLVTARANGVIAGFGMQGYELAVQRVLRLLG